MKNRAFSLLSVALLFFWITSCTSKKEHKDSTSVDLSLVGDSLAMLAQATLLKNVSEAIQAGGTVHAIDFCHTKAGFLTDSIGTATGYSIQRITDKPRNPGNSLMAAETELFSQIREDLLNQKAEPHYLLEDDMGGVVFYKPIVLGMPTCLKCHGQPGVDIDSATIEKLAERYPNDAATGYSLGQLRGLWKIQKL